MGDCPETVSLVWGGRFERAMTYMFCSTDSRACKTLLSAPLSQPTITQLLLGCQVFQLNGKCLWKYLSSSSLSR